MKFIISILFGVSMIMSTSSCTNHRVDPNILLSQSYQDTYNVMDTARLVCDTFSTVKAVAEKISRKITVNKMEFPTDVYYMMETDASGFKYSYPMLDTIPNLSKLIIREVWAQDRDSIKFEMILSLYMDNTYPNDKICSKLYKRIDQHIIDGLSYDTMEEDSMLWHKNKPYLRTKVFDYKNAWRNVINKLSQKYVCLSRETKYTQILDTYIFVLCHCIYEDENVITYIIESGNSFHGGCGCRNIADYLTFNKSNGHLLTKEEVINGVPKSLVNENIHSAFIGSADLKGFPVDDDRRTACFENANGAAVVSGGLLFYYYPYTIGCGAEGQYNLLIPNLSSSIKQ